MMKENRASKLHDLLERKSFNELSLSEKEFVIESMSESEYAAQRTVLAAMPSAYVEKENSPKPLVLVSNKTVKMIPLYQAIGAVAAVAALLIFTFTFFKGDSEVISNTEYIVQRDTIKVENVIYDTIVQNVQEKIYIQKEVYIENSTTTCQIEEPRLLESNATMQLPQIDLVAIENSGTSLKEDATAVLITDYLNTDF